MRRELPGYMGPKLCPAKEGSDQVFRRKVTILLVLSTVRSAVTLTFLTSYSVGILKYVKQHCTPQIKLYDTCLQENSNEPEKCIQALKELYFCTEVTAMNYKQSQQSPAPETKAEDKK